MRDSYVGTCDCPYDLMRNRRRCGGCSPLLFELGSGLFKAELVGNRRIMIYLKGLLTKARAGCHREPRTARFHLAHICCILRLDE